MQNSKSCTNPNCPAQNPQPITEFHADKHKPDGRRSRCKTCAKASTVKYNRLHAEMKNQKQREYYARAGDIQRQASRNWKAKNKAAQAEYWVKWYAQNARHRSVYFKLYAQAKPHIILEKGRRRRARKLSAEGSFTETEFRVKFRAYSCRCHWCGAALTLETVTRDHLIPLADGGRDDIGNIVPACGSCNARKRTKKPWEFMAGRLL